MPIGRKKCKIPPALLGVRSQRTRALPFPPPPLSTPVVPLRTTHQRTTTARVFQHGAIEHYSNSESKVRRLLESLWSLMTSQGAGPTATGVLGTVQSSKQSTESTTIRSGFEVSIYGYYFGSPYSPCRPCLAYESANWLRIVLCDVYGRSA